MIRFVVFEGPDCCGKTTQAKEIAKRIANNSNRAIYIHMPRVYKKELSSNFTNISNTICDSEFMANLFDNDNYCLKLLERILNENIDSNANDQMELLNQVERLTSKKLSDFYEFANTCMLHPESYTCYYKDKKLDMTTNDRDTLGEFYKDLTSDLYLIVDRFDFSGECYNGYVMHQMLNECAATEIHDETDKRALYDLGFKINMRERSRLNAISTRKTELTAKGIYFQYIFFNSSNVIKEKVILNKRQLSSYDKSTLINKYSEYYYNTIIDMINDNSNIIPNSLAVSTDNIYNYDISDDENKKNITDKLFHFITIPDKYLRTEFDKNIRVF